jgi:hypothetical protein
MADTDLEGVFGQLSESKSKPGGAGRVQHRLLGDGCDDPISEELADELAVVVPVEEPWRLGRPQNAAGRLKRPGQYRDGIGSGSSVATLVIVESTTQVRVKRMGRRQFHGTGHGQAEQGWLPSGRQGRADGLELISGEQVEQG